MIEWAQTAALALCSMPLVGGGYAAFFAWRARRRNADDLCGHCGGPQYAAPGYDAPALVQGRLVCAPCAVRNRRRTTVALATAGTLSGVAVVSMITMAVAGTADWAVPAVVGVQYLGVFGGAVAWMKRQNRAAVRLLNDAMTAGDLGLPTERAIVPTGSSKSVAGSADVQVPPP